MQKVSEKRPSAKIIVGAQYYFSFL